MTGRSSVLPGVSSFLTEHGIQNAGARMALGAIRRNRICKKRKRIYYRCDARNRFPPEFNTQQNEVNQGLDMLNYHALAVNPNVPAQATEALTELAIKAAFFPFPPLNAPVPLPIAINNIAIALLADSRFSLTPGAALSLSQCAISTVGGMLQGSVNLGPAPAHFKRVFSELVGAASSLSVAAISGHVVFSTVRDFNAIAGLAQIAARWPGNGPDYVCWDPVNGTFLLLESKGISSPPTATPRYFCKYKAQTLNSIVPFALQANVLSYVHLAAGVPLAVRWFNHRPQVHPDRARDDAYGLLVAFAQFTAQLVNGGLLQKATELRVRLSEQTGGKPAQIPRYYVDPPLVTVGDFLVPDVEQEHTIAISRAADLFFARLARGDWLRDDNERIRMLARFVEFQDARERLRRQLVAGNPDRYVGEISATGIAIIGR